MRPLLASMLAVAAAVLGVTAAGVAASPGAPQLVPVWTPEPGWQLVREHPVDPDLIVVGMFGERWADPNALPTTTGPNPRTRRRVDTANMPRLVLECENGVTALTVIRAPEPLERPVRARSIPERQSARGDESFAMERNGKIVLVFDDEERIDIDLGATPHHADPVYLPDPFDTIQKLMRSEILYYYEVTRGKPLSVSFAGEWGATPDAVFYVEGLGEFIDGTRDPCGWGR